MKIMKQGRITMRIFLMCLLAVLSLGACKDNINSDFKAKVIDECIQEKACMWRAFKEISLKSYLKNDVSSRKVFTPRWKKNITIKVVGSSTSQLISNIEKNILLFEDYFPFSISLNSAQANILVNILQNFNVETINKYKNEIVNFSNISEKQYGQFIANKKLKDIDCAHLTKRGEKREIENFILLVNQSELGLKKCVAINLYAALGFRHQGLFWLELEDYKKSIENASYVTDIHLIILGIYYHKDFPEEVNYESAYDAFNKIYPEILKQYNNVNKEG